MNRIMPGAYDSLDDILSTNIKFELLSLGPIVWLGQ